MTRRPDCIDYLTRAGFSFDDATALRRIAMTLYRWDELECGDGNNYASWSIERDEESDVPYFVIYPHDAEKPRRRRIADRERGAEKRLAAIVARYPGWQAYHQTDPRGASLYLIPPNAIPDGQPVCQWYNSRGIAVYK